MPNTQDRVEVKIINRLNPALYQKLEQRFSKLIVTSASTPLEAGYQLGVQAVLQELRNGYTIEG